jgi:DNA-binding transcriptional MerR regulator
MVDKGPEVIHWRTEYSLLTLEELASTAGLHPELVDKFIDYGLVEPATAAGSQPLFHVSSIERLRRIMRLRHDLGVNLAGVAVILEMRDRMENVQKALDRLRRRFGLAE